MPACRCSHLKDMKCLTPAPPRCARTGGMAHGHHRCLGPHPRWCRTISDPVHCVFNGSFMFGERFALKDSSATKTCEKAKTRLQNCSLWLLCRACHISVLGKANVQISSRVKSIPSIHPASYSVKSEVFHACEAGVPPASTRKIISPPCDLAKSQLNKAVRAPPTWSLRKHFAVFFVSFRWRQSL